MGSPSSSPQPNVGLHLQVTFGLSPVFGCRINPSIRLNKSDVKYELKCKWYREYISSSSADQIRCSVHPDKLAKVHCGECVKLELPFKGRYHCTNKCYSDSWKKHNVWHAYSCRVDEQSLQKDSDYKLIAFDDDSAKNEMVELDGIKWIELCSSESYIPTKHDINCRLRLESRAVECSSGMELCKNITTNPVLYHIAKEKPRSILECWRKPEAPDFNTHTSNGVKFSVLSYNLLADMYSRRDIYAHCPKWALSWEYRQQNLLNEIIDYEADILCLQEVQDNHLENFFKPELSKFGYSVIYKKKNKPWYFGDNYSIDGCATFYRHDIFKEVVNYELEFDSSVRRVIEALEPKERDVASVRLMKDNIALTVILEKLKNDDNSDDIQPRICVANTHIFANQNFSDVKLFQVVDFINGLNTIAAEMKIPILVCGDFNSLPLSEPYAYITDGKLKNLSKNDDPLGICQHLKPHHSLQLTSAYAHSYPPEGIEEEHQERNKMDAISKEPLFTNFTTEFRGTLDYIFYTEDSLTLEGVLELLNHENFGVGIPSADWSSDHIAIMARFRLNSTLPQHDCSRTNPSNPWGPQATMPRHDINGN